MDFCPIRGAVGAGGWDDALGLAGVLVPTSATFVIAVVVVDAGRTQGY